MNDEQTDYDRWVRHGMEYLMRERPWWSYLPVIAKIWEHGHLHGTLCEDQWHQKNPLQHPWEPR